MIKPTPFSALAKPIPPEAKFYPTPHWATRLLLVHEKTFPGLTWEPAAGHSHIAQVLKDGGCDVITSDLHNHGGPPLDYPQSINFLTETPPGLNRQIDNIVTNPPYNLAQKFVERAINVASSKVAMLMYMSFLESASRKTLFSKVDGKPARIYVFQNRLAMFPYGDPRHDDDRPAKRGGSRVFAWFVWDKTHAGRPQIDWIDFEMLHTDHRSIARSQC